MNRYIAFLRGINISGKNKIPMAELKSGLERIGFQAVRTHLNSGNVVFSTPLEEPGTLTRQISEMIKERFALDIPVFVLAKEALEEILEVAPVLMQRFRLGDVSTGVRFVMMIGKALGAVLAALVFTL